MNATFIIKKNDVTVELLACARVQIDLTEFSLKLDNKVSIESVMAHWVKVNNKFDAVLIPTRDQRILIRLSLNPDKIVFEGRYTEENLPRHQVTGQLNVILISTEGYTALIILDEKNNAVHTFVNGTWRASYHGLSNDSIRISINDVIRDIRVDAIQFLLV